LIPVTTDAAPEETPLIAALVQASYNQYASTSQLLIRNFQRDAARNRAERNLIREDIADLQDGPYAPSVRAIARALYPSSERVDARAAEYLEEAS
jgi:hypothetical protein